MSLKDRLRRVVHQLANIPYVGRIIRIAGATWRGPETRAHFCRLEQAYSGQIPALLETVSRLEQAYSGQIPALLETVSRLEQAYSGQIPALLETVSKLNQQHLQIVGKQENLLQSVPVALRELRRDASELKQTFANQNASVEYLLRRVEFIRRELMFELRYGAKTINAVGDALEVQPKIVSKEKLSAARRSVLRLNLGCGHIPLDGYLNVDRRELPGVDIVAEANTLPVEPGEVDEIFSAHMLEHFPQEQLRRELLPYWKSLLKPYGVFRAVVPDAETMLREYSEGKYPYEHLREVTFGSQDYNGDFHFNMFTPQQMAQLLSEAGFVDVTVDEAGRRNDICFEFEISARRPG